MYNVGFLLLLAFLFHLATQFLSQGTPFIFNSWIVWHLTDEDYAVFSFLDFENRLLDFFLIYFMN